MVNSFDNRYKHRSSILRNLQNLLEDDEQEFHLKTRNKQYENNEESDDVESGPEITLQNRAAMNTRLRVLYTDANGTPAIAETGRLWTGQTKSVKLPVGSKNINIIVEKDLFFETWRVAYKGTLTNENQCVRIVGVTLFSKIHPCK
ncbi:unnamed protein product [Adineta steineri]|uniref:Uncharacterized protein n=1 Tax=Adineta steineri TaxID=433720 RepID=A0A815A667_9BILA|nr:unnamed protein product [Adineta steineri]CAF1540269.1 unnamed protein product [Adineta steineri]